MMEYVTEWMTRVRNKPVSEKNKTDCVNKQREEKRDQS